MVLNPRMSNVMVKPPSMTASKGVTLVITAAAAFLTPFMAASVNIALPSMGKEFLMDAVLMGWVATSFLLSGAVFLVPFGRVADIYGRKKIFTYGFSVFTAASILCAVATSAFLFIIFRVLQGVGAAMIWGTSLAILTSVFPANERGKALGIYSATVYIGSSIGPFLGGLLTQQFGWRSIFFAGAILGLVIITLIFWRLRGEWTEARGERFDLVGAVAFGLSIIVMMYGFSIMPTAPGIILIIIGVLGISGFVRWEAKSNSPVLNLSLFKKNRGFLFSNLAALIHYSAVYAVSFLLSLYLQYTKGFSPQNAGLALVSQPIIMTIFSPLAGRLSDRIEPRIVASTGMALTCAALYLLSFLNGETTLEYIILSIILLGFGFAFFSSPNTNAVMSSVENKFYGIASATLGTMRLTGNMLSMGVVMIVLTVYVGRVQITPEYFQSFLLSAKVAFIIFGTLCLGGVFASLSRGKVREDHRQAKTR